MNKMNEIQQLETRADFVAGLLKQLAHPKRLLVLCMLSRQSLNVTELQQVTGLSQSALSQHLAKLKHHELIDCAPNGVERIYSVKDPKIASLLQTLYQLYCEEEQLNA